MYVERMTQWDAPGVTEQDWNRLSRGVPFRLYAWHRSWWKYYGQGGGAGNGCGPALFVLCAFDDDGRLAGVAPWYAKQSATGRRVVRCLGSGDVCSDYQTVLCSSGTEDDVARAMASWLCDRGNERNNPSADRWDAIQLDCVEQGDVALSALRNHFAQRGCLVHERAADSYWRAPLPNSWDDYLAELSKSHRKQVRRIERRYFDTRRAVHREVQTADELARGLKTLIELHQRRRQSLGEAGCFASSQFTAFHRDVAAQLLESGQLRLSWIELDGAPVAAEYHLAGGDVVYGYQSGLDPAALEHEPGRLAAVATMKRAIETGQRAFDFLRGNEPYKAHWRAESVPTIDVRVAPAKVTARLAHGAWLAGEGVRKWIKSGIESTAARFSGRSPAGSG